MGIKKRFMELSNYERICFIVYAAGYGCAVILIARSRAKKLPHLTVTFLDLFLTVFCAFFSWLVVFNLLLKKSEGSSGDFNK